MLTARFWALTKFRTNPLTGRTYQVLLTILLILCPSHTLLCQLNFGAKFMFSCDRLYTSSCTDLGDRWVVVISWVRGQIRNDDQCQVCENISIKILQDSAVLWSTYGIFALHEFLQLHDCKLWNQTYCVMQLCSIPMVWLMMRNCIQILRQASSTVYLMSKLECYSVSRCGNLFKIAASPKW